MDEECKHNDLHFYVVEVVKAFRRVFLLQRLEGLIIRFCMRQIVASQVCSGCVAQIGGQYV